jgi:glutathione S-transferase
LEVAFGKHINRISMVRSNDCSPFSQRVWITLEAKGIPYRYIEVDPLNKPPELLDINPRGLVPSFLHGNWGCYESTVLLEYVSLPNEMSSLAGFFLTGC